MSACNRRRQENIIFNLACQSVSSVFIITQVYRFYGRLDIFFTYAEMSVDAGVPRRAGQILVLSTRSGLLLNVANFLEHISWIFKIISLLKSNGFRHRFF